ncbi:glycosyltransferase family 4 protein [Aneurinibacillus sp. Ricciae_BoGa-3]|uniref:glycosyltransferase family 4 protein n=1 Tax=Aneurinibacillus sp. Ricciae_BoGa-3 TaxID=3022697 RepID=UPI0023419DB5|nr:glycosyltransferase family 4 protein [Aneurinibacillus sp. Ricciae_BoGa-3]WCK54486.1 glycosyltransferase family 4 protein [Aneurinibacillus sp. Ricciae_BoGa-3]
MTNYQVIWQGPIHRASGIGKASREYALALSRQGVNVKVLTNMKTQRTNTAALNPLIKKPYARNKRKVLIYHHSPNTINMQKERKRFTYIILNTVWETTKIPNNWFPNINKFDAVIVPSLQNKNALINSGVKVPIYIVPHGVYANQFKPANPKLSIKNTEGKFVFISVFGFQHRKNPETLLRAYWKEFSQKDKVILVIKTNGYRRHETHKWIEKQISAYKKQLGFGARTAPIVILTGFKNLNQLKGLYTRGNAFVLPTRGEGVGLPFLESLASGVPVITTRWGGHMDFLTNRNAFLLDYKLKRPAISMNSRHAISQKFRYLFAQKGQLWAEPDIHSLKKQMRYAYAHPGVCRKKGQQGRKDILKLSWNRAGITMKKAIEKVIREKR